MEPRIEPDDRHRRLPLPLPLQFAQVFRLEKMSTLAIYGPGRVTRGRRLRRITWLSCEPPMYLGLRNNKYGVGTLAGRSSPNTSDCMHDDKIPSLQVNGMDINASKQAVQYARN
ncbi:hypothetical protein BKA70DRAFT_727861 [Coprinopsis sp. MPI-PUGE-AT-0042]|nr:hypothetical protein BKA70DRAFT_727861 [Coprinopsis sp. MPI-PUGE-AT-0042]